MEAQLSPFGCDLSILVMTHPIKFLHPIRNVSRIYPGTNVGSLLVWSLWIFPEVCVIWGKSWLGGRFWIEKGYISYHFHNKQFRIVLLLHGETQVWATYTSAPFTILAKRKERVHGYNSVSAKWKRAANNEVRRRGKVPPSPLAPRRSLPAGPWLRRTPWLRPWG